MTNDVQRVRVLLGDECFERKSLYEKADEASRSTGSLFAQIEPFSYQQVQYAGYGEKVYRRLQHVVIISLVVSLLFAFLFKSYLVCIIPVICIWSIRCFLQVKTRERVDSFDRDYSALLLSLASALKAGVDPLMALSRSEKLFKQESVVRKELSNFNQILQSGATEDDAVTSFGKQVNHPDVKLFHIAFRLARKEGASLAYCLQRLAKVTRQRQSFRRKIRAAVAMQKLSAFGIIGCALLIALIQITSSTDAFYMALMMPFGQAMLGTGFVLMVTGVVWMLRISKQRI